MPATKADTQPVTLPFKRRSDTVRAVRHAGRIPEIIYTTNGPSILSPGDWLVFEADGDVYTLSDSAFRRKFQP